MCHQEQTHATSSPANCRAELGVAKAQTQSSSCCSASWQRPKPTEDQCSMLGTSLPSAGAGKARHIDESRCVAAFIFGCWHLNAGGYRPAEFRFSFHGRSLRQCTPIHGGRVLAGRNDESTGAIIAPVSSPRVISVGRTMDEPDR